MRTLITAILIVITSVLPAQRCDWFAPIDCGQGVNVRQMCADDRGNVYTAGEYTGEILFHSAGKNDTAITKYTSEHWRKTFIARYNNSGVLKMVVQFKSSGSNSSTSYVHGLKPLPNGDIVAFVEGAGDFVDQKGVRTKTGANGKGANLFCIDSLGRLKWSALTSVGNCKFFDIGPNGIIYIYGDSRSTYIQERTLLKYSAGGGLLSTVNTGGPTFSAMCLKGKSLYALVINGGSYNQASRSTKNLLFDMPVNNMGLFEFDTATLTPKKIFEHELPITQGYNGNYVPYFKACINYTSSELFIDILMNTDNKTTFYGKEFQRRPHNMNMFRIDSKGNYVTSTSFVSQYHNFSITPAPAGGVYLLLSVWGPSFKFGSDSLALPTHLDFIDELVLMKLDKSYNRTWWTPAGSTASNYHSSVLIPGRSGELYVASDIMEPGTVFGREVGLKWNSGAYVARLRE